MPGKTLIDKDFIVSNLTAEDPFCFSHGAGDTTEFQPGMTIHFMPALWQEDWGLEITESILITESGAAPLANVPRMLFVKE